MTQFLKEEKYFSNFEFFLNFIITYLELQGKLEKSYNMTGEIGFHVEMKQRKDENRV